MNGGHSGAPFRTIIVTASEAPTKAKLEPWDQGDTKESNHSSSLRAGTEPAPGGGGGGQWGVGGTGWGGADMCTDTGSAYTANDDAWHSWQILIVALYFHQSVTSTTLTELGTDTFKCTVGTNDHGGTIRGSLDDTVGYERT
uniref:Uncharacterized protein n=1 Tax=Knipowitschia caucasica TaxID=637954 RepID=A0AAV2M923_KNICA